MSEPNPIQPGDYFCGDCDRVEDDPVFLDTEMCSVCGGWLEYEMDEMPDDVWRNAATPFAENH